MLMHKHTSRDLSKRNCSANPTFYSVSRDVNWKELGWHGSLCRAWMRLTLLNCECHQSAVAALIQQYHLTAQCALRNVSSFQCSGGESVLGALHIWLPMLLFYMETGLESQVTHGMAIEPSTCTEAEVWVIFRRCRIQHMMLSPLFVFHRGVDGWKQQISCPYYRSTLEYCTLAWLQNILIAFPSCSIWGSCRLYPWNQIQASNLHLLFLLPV